MGGARKDVLKLIEIAKENGWTCERSGSGHFKLKSPTGATVILPYSPNSGRAFYYSRALLRKYGLKGKL